MKSELEELIESWSFNIPTEIKKTPYKEFWNKIEQQKKKKQNDSLAFSRIFYSAHSAEYLGYANDLFVR